MRHIQRAVGAALAVAMAAAWGGTGNPSGTNSSLLCPTTGTVCKVAVTVSAANVAQNDCGVKVVDRVRVKNNIQSVRWVVGGGGVLGNVMFRFNPTDGVALDNNTSGGQPLFTPEAVTAGDVYGHKALQRRVVQDLPYTLKLQWKKTADTTWNDCKPYDPLIANEG